MPSDEELLLRFARGYEQALAELLARYERPLSHFLYRHTGGQDVDDLYQETWLRVLRSAQRFDSAKRFSTWLFQIALNLCRDRYRRRRPPEPRTPPAASESTGVSRAEAGLDAARLLARLPEAQREVVILRYFHDLGEREIAAIVGCPPGTVKSRLHNALARLAALVAEESSEAEPEA